MMIIDVLPDHTLRYGLLNKAAEDFFSISHADYRGKPIKPYLGKDKERRARRDATIAAYRRSIAENTIVTIDMDHIRVLGR